MSTETATPTESARVQRSDKSLLARILEHPRPAMIWLGVFLVLLAPEIGAPLRFLTGTLVDGIGLIPGEPGVTVAQDLFSTVQNIPTLLSRDLIPNQGHRMPGGGWSGTFTLAGYAFTPLQAWLLRTVLIYVYSTVFLYWLWRGYLTFRAHYRVADWSPIDDQINRFRGHTWGNFGLVVVLFFVVMGVFAPALGPTTYERNIQEPYSYQKEYLNEDTGTVQETSIGVANVQSGSKGQSGNIGPLEYDSYDRFHPAGTLTGGKDLYTGLAHGARMSLFIGLSSIGLAGFIAVALAMITAYYKGLIDLIVVVSTDSIQSIPRLLLIIMAKAVFAGHWFSELFNGTLLLISLFALTTWTFIWRAIRGPALQVAEEEWIDAARSFGQVPRKTMQKHMLPYVIGYLLVYGSMTTGGIIIATAGLSFLGLGVTPPTPEWGRYVAAGQSYVTTNSWHISLIPGIMITLLVVGLNALGDGIRDAIDPESSASEGESGAAATGGGA
jgi:peptide/nickel transport system permease protein